MGVEYEDKPNIVQVSKDGTRVEISYGGPQGPSGADGATVESIPELVSYTHNQNSSSTTWTINHNLNFYPNVTVYDSAGSMVEGSVTHSSATSLVITFSGAISGKAYLS